VPLPKSPNPKQILDSIRFSKYHVHKHNAPCAVIQQPNVLSQEMNRRQGCRARLDAKSRSFRVGVHRLRVVDRPGLVDGCAWVVADACLRWLAASRKTRLDGQASNLNAQNPAGERHRQGDFFCLYPRQKPPNLGVSCHEECTYIFDIDMPFLK
jgi:hypothetical protein